MLVRHIARLPLGFKTAVRSQLQRYLSTKLPHSHRYRVILSRKMSSHAVSKTDQEWKAVLSPEQFRVLRQKGTEAPGIGEYLHNKQTGVYNCAACDAPLYQSTTKFESGCGWPAFYDAIPGAIHLHQDNSLGMARTEMTCANCGGHLGHVFYGEGYKTPTDARHCVNSISLKFKKEEN